MKQPLFWIPDVGFGAGEEKLTVMAHRVSLRSASGVALAAIGISGLVLGGCNETSKGEGATIRGSVTLEKGAPCPDVVVVLDGMNMETITNAQGKYAFAGLAAGTYAVAAVKPGYITNPKTGLRLGAGKTLSGINFILQKDPNYVPDSLEFVSAYPEPDSVLKPGSEVQFRVEVRYHLATARYGKIVLTLVDDKRRPLTPQATTHTVTSATDTIPFVRRLTVPNRIDGEVHLVAALFSGAAADSSAAAQLVYSVRNFNDTVHIDDLALQPPVLAAGGKVSVTATVNYTLDMLPRARLRLQVLGYKQEDKLGEVLAERVEFVDKQNGESGVVELKTSGQIPEGIVFLRIKADLVPPQKNDPLVSSFSRNYVLGESEGPKAVS